MFGHKSAAPGRHTGSTFQCLETCIVAKPSHPPRAAPSASTHPTRARRARAHTTPHATRARTGRRDGRSPHPAMAWSGGPRWGQSGAWRVVSSRPEPLVTCAPSNNGCEDPRAPASHSTGFEGPCTRRGAVLRRARLTHVKICGRLKIPRVRLVCASTCPVSSTSSEQCNRVQ